MTHDALVLLSILCLCILAAFGLAILAMWMGPMVWAWVMG